MGMEALKQVALDDHFHKTGTSRQKLAVEWGFNKDGGQKLMPFLEAEARKRLLFRGDKGCHRRAKRASDDFEHGLENFGAIREGARDVVVTTGTYLRQAILELTSLSQEHRDVLLAPPYTTARGPLKVVKYLRGHLLAESDKLAAEGEDHPKFHWTSEIGRVFLNEAGVYSFSPKENITAALAEKVQLRVRSFEAWDGSTLQQTTPPPLEQQDE
jgi:hypothetical protein